MGNEVIINFKAVSAIPGLFTVRFNGVMKFLPPDLTNKVSDLTKVGIWGEEVEQNSMFQLSMDPAVILSRLTTLKRRIQVPLKGSPLKAERG